MIKTKNKTQRAVDIPVRRFYKLIYYIIITFKLRTQVFTYNQVQIKNYL